MPLDSLLSRWHKDPLTAPNLPIWRSTPHRPAEQRLFPDNLLPVLIESLHSMGISSLYSHQTDVWHLVSNGKNIVLATGTASGKTLAYNLPVLTALLANENARALYLFPTKALAQDQLSALKSFQEKAHNLQAAIYDGDTPQSSRNRVRDRARIILSNPDMLHTGILPYHTKWEEFFRNLRFVVIDEMHTYRGVFGSHIANVIRRLMRVARFYGSNPQFILTSASIGNPAELAERLIEAPVVLVEQDGSGRGERHFLVFNPPVTDSSLGIRKSTLLESVRLAQDLLAEGVQSIVFARSRRSVEIILKYLQEAGHQETSTQASQSAASISFDHQNRIRGYRSGYLPNQRREIEQGLRDGSVRLVVATNALELGIDIGGLQAALLVGYPGTIASTWQQAGRAGRGQQPAIAVLVALANPLDQFLAHHPDYFFGRSPERALINPDHPLILLNHLRCTAFELPFQRGEGFGRLKSAQVEEYLQFLVSAGDVHASQDKYYWMADVYPAASVSLRSASSQKIILQIEDDGSPRTLGEVDYESAPWMVHSRAVYLHEGQQYYVQELNQESHLATLIPVSLDYYTEPRRQTELRLLNILDEGETEGGKKAFGEILVYEQVVGFRKRKWLSGENLGEEILDLPPSEFQTTAYWLSLNEKTIEKLREAGSWTSDPNDYGPEWSRLRAATRARDDYRCQVCGLPESGREHDVHHRTPFRSFPTSNEANRMDNLVTLCPACHRRAEANVRMRSGLAGLAAVLGQLTPLFLMCDSREVGVYADPQASFANGLPAVALFDQVPAGIGFSQKLFEIHDELMQRSFELVQECECEDGCPSCVGPAGENGIGGKAETLAIIKALVA